MAKTIFEQMGGTYTQVGDYLYPIPSGDRQLNPNLAQNNGWADGLDF